MFVGLNIYRLTNRVDTTQWAASVNLVKQTGATDTTWIDSAVAVGVTYYYRLTARDTGTLFNESFFTDTKFAKASLAANTTTIWYVNDTSYNNFSDSYSAAAGSAAARPTAVQPLPMRRRRLDRAGHAAR